MTDKKEMRENTPKKNKPPEALNKKKQRAIRLKVFYGWSKINKIQKREAIAVAFENEAGAGWENSRSGKSIRKTMTICYERYQTDEEMKDAKFHNRVFTVYNVFMDDKKIGGSLNKALKVNAERDRNHVSIKELGEIRKQLEKAFITTHLGYKEPTLQLEFEFKPYD